MKAETSDTHFRGHGKQALLLQACLSADMAELLGQQWWSSVPVSMASAAEAAGQAGLQVEHVWPQGSHQTTAGCDFGSHCAYGLASPVPDHCLNTVPWPSERFSELPKSLATNPFS